MTGISTAFYRIRRTATNNLYQRLSLVVEVGPDHLGVTLGRAAQLAQDRELQAVSEYVLAVIVGLRLA